MRTARLRAVAVVAAALVLPTGAPEAAQYRERETQPEVWHGIQMPFAATEEILEIGRRIKRLPGGLDVRANAIVDFIFSEPDGLQFRYRSVPTLTAAEAMEQQAGNCMSLVNLFIALARAADLDAYSLEVRDFVTFDRRGDTLVRSGHVVGGLNIGIRTWTFDFLPGREKRYRKVVRISETRHAALHYNAVAVEAMLAGDYDRAERLFRIALELDGDGAETWSNYAMLARRADDTDEAIVRLQRALTADPRCLPALTNLAGLYRLLGRSEEAAALEARALREKQQNPYFLLEESNRLIAAGELDGARTLLRRARHIDAEIPEVHIVLGRVELLRGDPAAASREFEEARRLVRDRSPAFQQGLDRKIAKLLELAAKS